MAISANEILDGLDDAQRRAACSVDGPVRIIACAGAGKTRTITRRIAYACASGAWEASRALAVTFSVKAAQEMRTRLLDLGVGEDMHIATFHSAALHQLRTMWPDVCEGPFPVLSESPRDLACGCAKPRIMRRLRHWTRSPSRVSTTSTSRRRPHAWRSISTTSCL